jgi:hypothetical protein
MKFDMYLQEVQHVPRYMKFDKYLQEVQHVPRYMKFDMNKKLNTVLYPNNGKRTWLTKPNNDGLEPYKSA